MGMEVLLDDFGTGYSSLSILKNLPVTHMKIDRSFVRDLETAQDDREIVQGLVAMAHSLRLQVIAEGVESISQMEMLKEFGCDFAQGYFFSKPLPVSELLERRSTKDGAGAQSFRK